MEEFIIAILTFSKFWSYLIGSKVIAYIDNVAIKYLLQKKDVLPYVLCWVLPL